jgi:hypothetical protein
MLSHVADFIPLRIYVTDIGDEDGRGRYRTIHVREIVELRGLRIFAVEGDRILEASA